MGVPLVPSVKDRPLTRGRGIWGTTENDILQKLTSLVCFKTFVNGKSMQTRVVKDVCIAFAVELLGCESLAVITRKY